MNPPFVPFTAALAQGAPRPATAAEVAGARAFAPIAPAPAAGGAHAHLAGEPKVTLERDGDHIKLIRIQCSCGETVELSCAY